MTRSRSPQSRATSAPRQARRATAAFDPWSVWTAAERKILATLTTPQKIQAFLDTVPYSDDPIYRCPRSVLRDRKAHCYDGALFACAVLRLIGHPPIITDMLAERDDDHILALFQVDGHWGAIAKSNFSGLRFREPIHRSLRELVLTYFEDYYNMDREKSLRGYTQPLDLRAYDTIHWMTEDKPMDLIAEKLDQIRKYRILTPKMRRNLAPIDGRSYDAGMVGVNMAGVYFPPPKKKG